MIRGDMAKNLFLSGYLPLQYCTNKIQDAGKRRGREVRKYEGKESKETVGKNLYCYNKRCWLKKSTKTWIFMFQKVNFHSLCSLTRSVIVIVLNAFLFFDFIGSRDCRHWVIPVIRGTLSGWSAFHELLMLGEELLLGSTVGV